MINIGRQATLISLFEFANYLGLNLYAFFGLTVKLCEGLENSYSGGCDEIWREAPYQGSREQSRITLTNFIGQMEQRVADYVGYWPGPKYISDERHFMTSWSKIIETKYRKVVKTGTRRRTLLFSSDTVTMTREFISPLDISQPTAIRYKFGTEGQNLNLPTDCNFLFYPQGLDELDAGSGDKDPDKKVNEGYVLKPYSIVECTDEFLTIDIPIWVGVKPNLYFEYPDIRDNITAIDVCNEDNFVDQIAVYGEFFERPDGYAKIDRRRCNHCGGSGSCDRCDLPEVPICLTPIHSEHGRFRVTPVRNTAEDGEPACWVPDDWANCCSVSDDLRSGRTFDNRFAADCFCTSPLEICISYVSSCTDCFGTDCVTREVCPEMLAAIAKMAMSDLPIVCKCDCLQEMIQRWRDDWTLRGKGFSRAIYSDDQFALGLKVGHVEAWQDLQRIEGRHREFGIGMIG